MIKKRAQLMPDLLANVNIQAYIIAMVEGQNALLVTARESGRKRIAEEIEICKKDPEYFNNTYKKHMKASTAAPIKIIPMDDRYAVLADEAQDKTVGGIIIPDTAKETQQKGTIVAVGTGREGVTMHLKLGDRVAFGKYAGQEYLHDDGKTYLMMRQTDIFAIVDLK